MVAQVEIPGCRTPPATNSPLALNAHLPSDIRVMSAARCRAAFDARFDAKGKQYRYFVWNHPAMNPLLRHQAWHVARPLDLPAMRAAAQIFLGPTRFQIPRRHAQLRNEIHRAHAAPLRHPAPRAAADLHHRGRRLSLQNVPRHCRNPGASGAGKIAPAAIKAFCAARTAAPPA